MSTSVKRIKKLEAHDYKKEIERDNIFFILHR